MLEVAKIRRAVKISPQSSKTSQANARRWMLLSLGILIGFGICKPAAWAQTYDGPAELPLTTVASAMADTPAPGSIISVNASGDLQGAINRAHCGDIVELQAGATYSGQFILSAKNCDNKHWVIIRTSASDSLLPAEGQRATPCYAGVATLVGRPQYPCNNPQDVMAKVQMNVEGDGPFLFA